MAKYKVLRPIEHNHKMYLPEGAPEPTHTRSGGNGQKVEFDNSGYIDLPDNAAARMTLGQIEAPSATQIPNPAR